MSAEGGNLALIINTASYDRVAFALSLANTAAAMGKEVAVLFGYGGLVRLKRGAVDEVGDETEAWIRGQIKLGLQKGSITRISELLETLTKLRGKIYACPSAMALHNLVRDELIDQVNQVCGLAEFLSRSTESAATTLYV